MSRIFDALRKSEKQIQEQITPEVFIETMEKIHAGLAEVAVERIGLKPGMRVVVCSDASSLGAERFRFLRAQLSHCCTAKKLKTILITSPLPQDGKSLVAVNLATALVGREKSKVLLVEADMRRAGLMQLLGLSNRAGLSECLQEGSDAFTAIRRIEPLGFFLFSAGKLPANPIELLQSQRFADVMRSLTPHFDWVLIDSPPVSPLADTPVLKTHADGTLLVVRAGITSRESIEEAVQLLGLDHIVGVVLNGAHGLERLYYSYYAYYSRSSHDGAGSKGEKEKSNRSTA